MNSAKLALGDMMMDFSITDCEGTEYQLFELLNEKKAVMLNFWYLNCEPCKMEFPFVQEAYEACGDDVAFLAMNPVDGTNETVAAFKAENKLTFSVSACDSRWQNVLNLNAFPTTLIIDRYGYIVASHRGMFTESAEMISALEYITSDGYQHEIFDSIAEVPSVSGN
jgi:thiol-disulfide isomerase/thioredoxin